MIDSSSGLGLSRRTRGIWQAMGMASSLGLYLLAGKDSSTVGRAFAHTTIDTYPFVLTSGLFGMIAQEERNEWLAALGRLLCRYFLGTVLPKF